MKYLETKHERNSAKITTLIVVILLLLLFVMGPPYMDPPLEYGVAVNFGNSDVGSGDVQPLKPVKSEPKEVVSEPVVKEEKVEEVKTTPTKSEQPAENVMTEDNAEAIAMKKQKEAADAKASAEAIAKAEVERAQKAKVAAEAKKRQEEADKRAKLDALIGGVKKSDGKTTGGEGNDGRPGDKGQLDGDPYAASYFGQPGTGSGGSGSGYGLNGRGRPTNGKVVPDCDEEGRVVVEIHVNRDGRVVNAIPGKKGTTGDLCLYEAARKTAMTYKWPADSKAPSTQIGFVKIDFSVTQ
ncbi:energy transducer TonB [Gelidibacter salicanalis]|uniref:Energy transducer TonB n=1 Tax=Gelidibacter salicanalis TaxID=291193 RepID=A0A934NI07_9FLAO|nr:energy transducer TonB [Gelidibacter salicanalis]MBJ7880468.1 energy transducer TonB [Gelidibacter salicanalis]